MKQPILSKSPEPGHNKTDVLQLTEFIQLLKDEEDYYDGEQHNTKLMITRLRKIFYDQWGWNKELIENATAEQTRYVMSIVDDGSENTTAVVRYSDFKYAPKHRLVTYGNADKVYGSSRAGQTPEIVRKGHQEVLLPDGYYCDIAHILAGADAYNYPQVVSPLPKFLRFAEHLMPHVDSNMDIVTWLGDIASSSGGFLFNYLRHKNTPNSPQREQYEINIGAPGSDMLGNIDSFIISNSYDIGSENGLRFTDILTSYYFDENSPRKTRFSTYCKLVGLTGWNGTSWKNEDIWKAYYYRQLRDNVSFQVFSLTDQKLDSVLLPIKVWFGFYRKVLKVEGLLELYLNELKILVTEELKQLPK